jgi:RelA/SpoT family (p)ppGpp synthetase
MEKEYDFDLALKLILKEVNKYYPSFDEVTKNKIKKAFAFAKKAHEGQLRFSGKPYFTHPVEATKVLIVIRPDIETILACLLHDVIEDTPVTSEEIENEFGKNVRFLCESVAKISRVQIRGGEKEKQYENLQKLFLAIAKDIRVIFIKLADRIHNLSTLEFVPKNKQNRICRESLEIYAPVADKLGLFEFKLKIEDLSFKYLHPKMYEKINAEILETEDEREKMIKKAKAEIQKVFRKEKFVTINIQGRRKNLNSIYEKMQRKNISSANEIYDLFGIRIVVTEKPDCYQALGILHSYWNPMPGRFKDYISVSKPNGYQSLHTTILGLGRSSIPTEIQIRTKQMDLDAEYGPAAHWAYKKVRHSSFDKDYIKRTSWFPENIPIETQQNPEKFFKKISNAILKNRIYVFTPKGDIKTLPAKSTPIDFAFAIHSQVGESCIGARVNGIIKTLDYQLQGGEVVEIMTQKGRSPNPAWIDFVQSSHAKNRIKQHINTQQNLYKKDQKPEKPSVAKKRMRVQNLTGKTTINDESLGKYNIIIGGEEGLSYRLANCCNPRPEQGIFAYNSRGMEFVIHRHNCPSCKDLDPERFLEAHFIIQKKFSISAKDRKGLMNDFSRTISERGIFIWDIKFKRNKNNMVLWTFVVNIPSEREFRILIKDILAIPNVVAIREASVPSKK